MFSKTDNTKHSSRNTPASKAGAMNRSAPWIEVTGLALAIHHHRRCQS